MKHYVYHSTLGKKAMKSYIMKSKMIFLINKVINDFNIWAKTIQGFYRINQTNQLFFN